MSCAVKVCPREAVRAMGGMVALVLGLLFTLVVDDDLTLHLCRRHHEEALLVAKAVLPDALDPSELHIAA